MSVDLLHQLKAYIKTPSFWNGSLAGIKQFSLSELDLSHFNNNFDHTEFPEIPANTILGKRAEHYFEYCIQQCSNYELIASNIQINVARITKGELDFIIKEICTGKILHVELVNKFYCYDPNSTEKSEHLNLTESLELSKYVGPNKRDNFVFKFDRLVNHQLPLLFQPATLETLSDLNLNIDTIEQRVCFLAHIYIPRELWQQDFNYINKRCIAGYYMNFHAFAKANTTNQYYLPEKRLWIGNCHILTDSYSYEEVVYKIEESLQRGFAPMVWMQLETKQFESFFVIA
ncbi:hypothetical protein BBFL7_00306 [Flavobacteria bacterium BBFL7]|nr:hypothetical protein BBFL7_00306 [Flavobacteria bacterium BBFL7]